MSYPPAFGMHASDDEPPQTDEGLGRAILDAGRKLKLPTMLESIAPILAELESQRAHLAALRVDGMPSVTDAFAITAEDIQQWVSSLWLTPQRVRAAIRHRYRAFAARLSKIRANLRPLLARFSRRVVELHAILATPAVQAGSSPQSVALPAFRPLAVRPAVLISAP